MGSGGWWRLCDYLQDPWKVARFQRLCGVEAAYFPSSSSSEAQPNGAVSSEAQQQDAGPRHRNKDCQANGTAHPPDCKKKPQRRNSLTGEVGQEFIIRNRFLYFLFCLATELGNELFYISFFPLCIWNVDPVVGRKVIVIWVWVMYLGQCTKDLIRWPRPPSPPVVKLEVFYNTEYGMPSTHAMSGTAIPISILLLTYGRWQYPFTYGLLLAIIWCSLVCLSRVYMGMHSVLVRLFFFFFILSMK
ncbi:hypothetical protein XELAEV_18039780mg [Xenopus laevis]|uniref:Phosphatidic acid phosphatase type 2/haloperoxidase domain-containing protein n=1 Tax=Xenopus laevis TaxID=8355 RepID=A0A974H896_XENLA|nr:hypothetical protein XELAEV_18039780mg [Xenopus laevis]